MFSLLRSTTTNVSSKYNCYVPVIQSICIFEYNEYNLFLIFMNGFYAISRGFEGQASVR